MPLLTRRTALGAAAALPLTAVTARPALAQADMQGPAAASFKRFALGAFEVTVISAGQAERENPHSIFGMDQTRERFDEVSTAHFLPTDRALFQFSPTLVNTGEAVILFDTGLSPEGTTQVLGEAGITPDQIDTVVITHMHGDHIGGLYGDAGATFPNAALVTGAIEDNHWRAAESDGYAAKVAPLSDRFSYLEDGDSVVSGITAMAAFGHTPGHMVYHIESDGARLLVFADTANHYVWSIGYPDWEVRFDADKAAAAATRRRVLDMLAADRVPFIGYHMPFPSLGYVAAEGDGFRYVPESYQMSLS